MFALNMVQSIRVPIMLAFNLCIHIQLITNNQIILNVINNIVVAPGTSKLQPTINNYYETVVSFVCNQYNIIALDRFGNDPSNRREHVNIYNKTNI